MHQCLPTAFWQTPDECSSQMLFWYEQSEIGDAKLITTLKCRGVPDTFYTLNIYIEDKIVLQSIQHRYTLNGKHNILFSAFIYCDDFCSSYPFLSKFMVLGMGCHMIPIRFP